MASDFKKAAESFLSSEKGKRISERRGDIENLAASTDGQQVRSMLQNEGFGEALKSGDSEAMKNAIGNVLKTDAGARLMQQLRDMMGTK